MTPKLPAIGVSRAVVEQGEAAVSGEMVDTFSWERQLYSRGCRAVGGVDEAGRGPLAGPVVAACVVLPSVCVYSRYRDSKVLTARQRQILCLELQEIGAVIGVGMATAAEVDSQNILRASLLAMRRAVEELPERPDFLLVDGKFEVPLHVAQQPLIKGERHSASIAAASIIAKVRRDAIMDSCDENYPLYLFRQHKGYPTREHRRLIQEHGPSPIHRLTFKGVKEYLATGGM